MDLQKYLQRINFTGNPDVSAATLNVLHRAHVLNVPFENFHIINRIPIVLDQEKFYSKIVENGRGGFCYELNGLFSKALQEIGFTINLIGCGVFVPPRNEFGSQFGHIALIATVGGEDYLVDVGFGDAFTEPLRLQFETPVMQYGTYYRLTKLAGEEILLEKSPDNLVYQKMYKFTTEKRKLEDFAELCEFHQVSPLAPFNKKPLCTKATAAGRITLTSSGLTITEAGNKNEVPVLSSTQFDELLEEHFGMKFTADSNMNTSPLLPA